MHYPLWLVLPDTLAPIFLRAAKEAKKAKQAAKKPAAPSAKVRSQVMQTSKYCVVGFLDKILHAEGPTNAYKKMWKNWF